LTDKGKGRKSSQDRRPSSHRLYRSQVVLPMSASVAQIMRAGKLFPWPRPGSCPRCGGRRLWGHGFVPRYFDGLPEAVWVKRWRCPDCMAVHTCRPSSHWRRFLTPIAVILASLAAKLAGFHWPQSENRQRQQYWHRGYVMQSRFDGLPPATIVELLASLVVVATHSTTDRTTLPLQEPPHPSLAATAPP